MLIVSTNFRKINFRSCHRLRNIENFQIYGIIKFATSGGALSMLEKVLLLACLICITGIHNNMSSMHNELIVYMWVLFQASLNPQLVLQGNDCGCVIYECTIIIVVKELLRTWRGSALILIAPVLGLSLICFLFCLKYYSILQFLKISPIILPNMPIILLLFSSVTHICWCVMKI